jgi:Bacterial TSP3 repeat
MRRARRFMLAAALTGAALIWSAPAAAQPVFPDEAAWSPLPCGKGLPAAVMNDLRRDQSGAVDERDLVGDIGAAAGYSASDATFLYLRLRLDRSPLSGKKLRPFAWGVAISTDKEPKTYELLISVNGNASKVEIYRNTATTVANSLKDPADTPAAQSYPFATHGLVELAPLSAYGGDDDHFISFAVPWSALKGAGLTPSTPVQLWAGSSSTVGNLNADIACHDGASGAPTLSGVDSGKVSTSLDPTRDTDGDGFTDKVELEAGTDPQSGASKPPGDPPEPGPSVVDLEGGGGCSLSQGLLEGSPAALLLLGLALLLLRRRG